MCLRFPAAVCSCRSACAGILDSFWTPFGPVQLLLLDAICQYLNLRLEPTAAHLHAPTSPLPSPMSTTRWSQFTMNRGQRYKIPRTQQQRILCCILRFIKLLSWSCCLTITLHNFPMRCEHSCRLKSPTTQRYFTGSRGRVQAWCMRHSVKNAVLRIQAVQAPFSDVLHNKQTNYSLNETVVWRNYFPRPSQLVCPLSNPFFLKLLSPAPNDLAIFSLKAMYCTVQLQL